VSVRGSGRSRRRHGVVATLVVLALGAAAAPAQAAPKQLLLGFGEIKYSVPSEEIRRDALDKTVAVNGDVVRINAPWGLVSPEQRPSGFDPTDPGDPAYDWSQLDAEIEDATARGLTVMLLVQRAPRWAEGKHRPKDAVPGTWKPDPHALGEFATALAKRYSGSYHGLPRVRYFECWGEANLRLRLAPLWGGKNGKKPIVVNRYRKMLNSFYDGIHAADDTNKVVTAALSPYGAKAGLLNVRPLEFWRPLLCVKDNKRLTPKRHCNPVRFDVLAHNPIGHGPPGTKALDPDDISVPDLHRLVDVLRASERAGNVEPAGLHRPVWATELWWESRPPDPYAGNPGLKKQAAWYVKSFYSLWRQGASMVLLLQVLDLPYNGIPGRGDDNLQTGVFFIDGKPKPSATGFRFPFLADRRPGGRVVLWGKAPADGELTVTERGKPAPVAQFEVSDGEVFSHRIRLGQGSRHKLRAEVGGVRSLTWTVK
jgi:hypothetical protein